MDYLILLGALETVLGKGSKRSEDNYAFHCPFCHHRKPKLEVNLHTNEKGENHFACWTCMVRGKSIRSLLTQMKLPREEALKVLQYVPRGEQVEYKGFESLELPKEFKPLHTASETSVIVQKIKKYLFSRGWTELDFIRYNIGYCTSGKYNGRIIIPSYDEEGRLNYFIGRTYEDNYIRYLLPDVSRDVVPFENLINWNQPIILCEGVFDVIGGARRNAIPLLGKNISHKLMKKILENSLEDVYVALDNDALKEALRHCETLLRAGKNVYLVSMTEKDPSQMGFIEFTHHIQNVEELTFTKILEYKLEL